LSKPIDTVLLNTILEKWIPKDKQKSVTLNDVRKAKKRSTKIKIDGLDVKDGIRHSGGSIEYYYQTLATFYSDGQKRIAEIRRCTEVNDILLYTINVHALKSAAANIGATELSKAASALEKAGNRNDLMLIKENNDKFLLMLEEVLGNIDRALSSHRGSIISESFDMEQLKNKLLNLKEALKGMDARVINQTIEELLRIGLTENYRSTMQKISNHVLLAEYHEAVKLIDSIISDVSSA